MLKTCRPPPGGKSTKAKFAKPEPRKRTNGRAKRQEATVIATNRAIVAARDGRCRLDGVHQMGICRGPAEWAHLGSAKRFNTRGQDPEIRHSTRATAMLCRDEHHYAHDKETGDARLHVESLTPDGANGPLLWLRGVIAYREKAVR